MDTKEYIVVLNERSDLDDFYTDMEHQGRHEYVPDRSVEMVYRRPMSRSTHYLLTDEEAAALRQDPRVLDVEEPYYNRGIEVMPLVQTSNNWSKGSELSTRDLNWGLLRGFFGIPLTNWGSNGSSNAIGAIDLTNVGYNVDVVIIDGHILPEHPEFAKNPDGTGGSRVVKEDGGTGFNWFKYNPQVRGTAAGTYVYDFGTSVGAINDNNHGAHVAGTAAGNTGGWARGANIYNISPYSTTSNCIGYNNYFLDLMNYVRVFHANKPINPLTGRRNPTICNMSYGYSGVATIADITSFVYRGVTTQRPAGGWTNAQLANFGVTRRGTANNIFYPARIADIDADIVDAIADGIIFCGAAGNDSMYNERLGGDMYDNYFVIPSGGINYGYFYHRGMSPTAATGVINVSAIDSTVIERKVAFSNAGPRTDIFAAGTNIMSSINDPSQSGGVGDVRSIAPNTFWKNKLSGTSMASPQVTGIVACALETYPNMTPAEALTYAQTYANSGVLVDTTINTDFAANELIRANTLFNGPNLFMTYRQERDSRNQVYPKLNYSYRPTSGLVFPRTRARKFG